MTKSDQGKVILCMTIYVDDCLIAGKNRDVEEAIMGIENTFKVKRMGDAKTYLEYTISRDREQGNLSIHQRECIESIQVNYNVGTCKTIRTPAKVGNEQSTNTGDYTVQTQETILWM